MNNLEELEKIIKEHETKAKPEQTAWYTKSAVCMRTILNARKRGSFFVGDAIFMLNERCKMLGLPGKFTSKSNPIAVAVLRGMIESRLAKNQTTRLLDIESTLEYLRQYKPRRREERS